ncbi:smad nuclear-interacting protein 1 [Vigna unguiculata]|uniref:Smad nuclear-interacting protein 1 n=1 Tax=Vigna unguiculata TaxID=3917 RepID=A0A4D6KP94_VIGUN|nr:smad nuclear-interacting protein 1 [Vigna unguiculata]
MGRHSSGNHSPSSRRHRSHRSISPPLREQHERSGRGVTRPVRSDSGSPDSPARSRSPSPRTKRLKRAQTEREPRESERSRGSSRGRGSEREAAERREKRRTENDGGGGGSGRSSKSEKRTENEDTGGRSNKSSRSRHERSPERERNGRSRHRSQSPPHRHASSGNAKPRDEISGGNFRKCEASSCIRVDQRVWQKKCLCDWEILRMSYVIKIEAPTVEVLRALILLACGLTTYYKDEENDSIRKMKAAEEALEEKQKQKPSFELSGNLAAETNRVRGVTLLFNEPPEARKPDIKWRLYVFKGGEVLNEPLYIHRQSCYLFGRERRVADIPTDHPSCSKQHAVIQFRQVEKEQPDGTLLKQIRPYIMDLGSTNKTLINDSPIEPQRYYELREKDTIKFVKGYGCFSQSITAFASPFFALECAD